jgi:hypothetical protein
MTEKYDKPILHVFTLILLVALVLTGCTPVSPTEAQSDSADPIPPAENLDPVRTEVAQTVVAEITVESIADASDSQADATGAQSSDPIETEVVPVSVQNQKPTGSPTLPQLATPTETAVANSSSGSPPKAVPAYDCLQKRQDPLDGYKITPGGRFDITWAVQNTGTVTWETPTFDYMYLKGDELHIFGDRKDLPREAKTGETVDLFVNMEGPAEPGIYRTWWAVVDGHANPVCIVYLSIEVTN